MKVSAAMCTIDMRLHDVQKQRQATHVWKPLEADSDTNNHPQWRSQPVAQARPVDTAADSSLLQPEGKSQQPDQQETLQSTGQKAVHLQQDAVLHTHESERPEEQNEESQLQQQQLVKQPAEKVARQEPRQQMTKQEPEMAQQQRIEQQHPQHQPENVQLPMIQIEQQFQKQPEQHQVAQYAMQQTADLESEPVHASRCVLTYILAPSVVLAFCECSSSTACLAIVIFFSLSLFFCSLFSLHGLSDLPSAKHLLQYSMWHMPAASDTVA